ncbi:MAG: putative Ig domain-containing protein, partial [Candidatus Zixiibacteriota bacterium]
MKFYASDGTAVDSEQITISVIEAGNQAPVLAVIGNKSVAEGVLLSFNVSATDPDQTTPSFTTSTLPTGAAFVDNGNGTGSFSWTPNFTQAGVYPVRFRALDGVVVDTEIVTITVTEAGNQAPILAVIGNQSTTEGVLLTFNVSATDADGTIPNMTTSTRPTGANFVNNGNGTGTFTWTPTFAQAGVYNIRFYAGDGIVTDSENVTITVGEAGNQAPVLATIGPRNTTENVNLNFNVSATDADGTTPVLTTSTLPGGASFNNNGNGTGTFNWTPTFVQAGVYNIVFRASDGVLVDTEIVVITVFETGNQAPILATIGNRNVNEGINLNFNISATDADGTTPNLTTTTLPTGATFINNGNGTGTFNWTPSFTQSGIYNITFRATDGSLTDTEIVTITVNEAGNQAPVLADIGPKGTTEGVNLNFNVSATDADGTIPTFTTSALPSGASFVNNGNGTATFNWTPTFVQSGTYFVTFRATDGALVDTERVTIAVNEVGNQAPILATIGSRSVNENVLLTFNVSATDADGTIPALSTSARPTGANFVNNGNGTGTFTWTPTFIQSGTYFIIFFASDGVLVDSETVQIIVNEAGNQAPILATIGNRSVTENVNLNFNISAIDPDGTTPNFSTSTLPTGATFIN